MKAKLIINQMRSISDKLNEIN